ncbi:biofilm regulation diguanylate cyclase SiaD [Nitrincola sp. MINF-07-Sa-05]|uniref:biofilm regulation diguanylate cyclase SiaD n=1 Tax=Nitrincola salilacus TaxID=3400273 RepID=UPI003917EDA6
MTDRDSETPEWITSLLEDPANENSPLLPALKYLLEQDKEHRARLDRMLRISDGYGNLVHNQSLTLSQRYDKQLRRLEKITRISDRYQQEMMELNLTLRQAALHDPLTGLPNRRMILERMKAELARQGRGCARFSLIMLDVDHFKHFNDTYGHETGDAVLSKLAEVMQHTVREYDLCARWGGEEFLILLPETDLKTAQSTAERLLQTLRTTPLDEVFRSSDQPHTKLTASLGVATYQPDETLDETINRADSALLSAKQNGRDRVELNLEHEDHPAP